MQIVPLLWMHMFDKKLPAVVEEEQLRKNNSELSIDDVAVWIESNKGLEGRFCWFETLARETNFYQKLQGGCYLLVLLDLLMWNEGPRG